MTTKQEHKYCCIYLNIYLTKFLLPKDGNWFLSRYFTSNIGHFKIGLSKKVAVIKLMRYHWNIFIYFIRTSAVLWTILTSHFGSVYYKKNVNMFSDN